MIQSPLKSKTAYEVSNYTTLYVSSSDYSFDDVNSFAAFFPQKFNNQDSLFISIALATGEGKEAWGYVNEKYINKYSYTDVPKIRNFLNHTFLRLQYLQQHDEDKHYFILSKNEKYLTFNSGLQNSTGNDLFLIFSKFVLQNNRKLKKYPPWFYMTISASNSSLYKKIFGNNIPRRAWYSKNPSELIFDSSYKIGNSISAHVFERAKERMQLPMPDEFLFDYLTGTLCNLPLRLQADIWRVVPCFYTEEQRIDFVAPLHLHGGGYCALLLAKNDETGEYIPKTVLELDQAFGGARLISAVKNDWLNP